MSDNEKYLKYKTKYLHLKNNIEGGGKDEIIKIIFVRHGEATHNIAVNEIYNPANIILTDKGCECIRIGTYIKFK